MDMFSNKSMLRHGLLNDAIQQSAGLKNITALLRVHEAKEEIRLLADSNTIRS